MNSNSTIQDLLELTLPSIKSPPHRRRNTATIPLLKTIALALAWVFALLCPIPAGAQSYTATFLGQGGDYPLPSLRGLNDHGEVVGHYFPDGTLATPVVWRNGAFTELPLLPGTIGGVARANNNAGQVVGFCFDENGAYLACIWENGSVRALPVLAGTYQAEALDINDAGGVTGYALVEEIVYPDGWVFFRQDAVVWQGGSVQAISRPYAGAQDMVAQAIDASGRVAVSVYDEWMGGWMPGRWTPDVPNGLTGSVQLLDWAGFSSDLNDSGVVCGYDGTSRAVLWNGSTATVIGVLPGHYWANATRINASGTVVGTSTWYDDEGLYADYAAFVWTAEDGMRNLNALLNDGSHEFGVLTDSLAINNAGQILTLADNGFVLLTPSPLLPPLPAPTGLSSQAGDSVVSLSWDPVTVASSYNVKRSTTSGGPFTTIATGVSVSSYLDQTAVNGIRYYYVVTALDDARESANSNETSARPLATPLAPSGLLAKVAKAKVTLTWRQSTSPEIQLNRVYRSTNGGAYVLVANIPAGLTWTDNSARSKTNYRYVVTAVNSIGLESPVSNSVNAQPK